MIGYCVYELYRNKCVNEFDGVSFCVCDIYGD